MTHLNIRLDIHNAHPLMDDPEDIANSILSSDVPNFSPGETFEIGDAFEGAGYSATTSSVAWEVEAPPWAIDPEGRVFFEGRWAFTVTRRPDLDGRLSTRFTVEGVWVTEDPQADDPVDVFDTGVSGVGGKTAISRETWEAVNREAVR